MGVGCDEGGIIRSRLSNSVRCSYEGKPIQAETLLTTGLPVPIGQMVVLGSAAPGDPNQAVILAVRPEVPCRPRPPPRFRLSLAASLAP